MTSATRDPHSTILISGLTLALTESLKHTLLIKLSVDGTNIASEQLKGNKEHIIICPFREPREIRERCKIVVKVQEKQIFQKRTLVRRDLSLVDIWQGLTTDTSESQTKKYEIRLNDPKKRLWLNVDVLSSTSQAGPSVIEEGFHNPSCPSEQPENPPRNATTQEPRATRPITLDDQRGQTDPTKLSDLQEIKNHLLEGIKLASSQATECLAGTRTTILTDVAVHIDDPDGPNAIWIRGAPGSGKSSISLTAKTQICRLGRLVTYFRFDRNQASTTTSTALWRQVAYGLACRLPSVRARILKRLQAYTVDLDSPMDVFTSLVEEPLKEFDGTPPDDPLVVIVDALDECGGFVGYSSPDRRMLLQTLGRWHKLPKYIRLLATSREENDITQVLSTISTLIDIASGRLLSDDPTNQASVEASNDIRAFLRDRFSQITRRLPLLGQDWPRTNVISEMVDRAAGNFMWATTAAAFIRDGPDPQVRLDTIMSDIPGGMMSLYSLYSTIFNTSFGKYDDSDAEKLRAVLGTMVFAKRSLSDDEYTKLPPPTSINAIVMQSIREGLGSVICTGSNLRFVHKSFDDFLLSEQCPQKYRIRLEDAQCLLTNLCVTTMTHDLRFNICDLETSYSKNTDVPDIDAKVKTGISTLLSYSCFYWAEHLRLSPFSRQLMREVRGMILDKLLYWFEAMSLLKGINRVSPSLLLVSKWSHPSPDGEFQKFVDDARRFIGAFGYPISQSAPHIYISALAFTPEQSLVARHFLSQFPGVLTLIMGRPTDWSPCIFTSEHQGPFLVDIVLSRDEEYFVSLCRKNGLCMWDSETGNLISKTKWRDPFGDDRIFLDPNSQHVWTVNYIASRVTSQDIETGDQHLVIQASELIGFGFCCFNGSRNIVTICRRGTATFWDDNSGEELRKRHICDATLIMVSCSPDGCDVAGVVLGDPAIRIWSLVNGSEIRGQSHSQPHFTHVEGISVLSFSTDGNFVVSGSKEGTVLVWDARTGDTVGPLLAMCKDRVCAVAYSPQSNLVLAVAEGHNTVAVRNVSMYEAILGPLVGHSSSITAIALSRDGRRALTASDGTTRMWDLSRVGGVPTTDADKCHIRGPVTHVSFSPCGKKLFSVDYDDGKAQIWDASTGKPLCTPWPFHEPRQMWYAWIIFSPDGSQILSYDFSEHIFKVWDAGTGELVFHHDLSDSPHREVTHIAFRPTDQRLVTCFSRRIVRIWNLQNDVMTEDTSASSPELVGANQSVEIVALSPDGSIAIISMGASDNHQKCCYLWSTTTYRLLSGSLAFSYDKCLLASSIHLSICSHSGRFCAVLLLPHHYTSILRIWDTRTGESVDVPSPGGDIDCPVFSPDECHVVFSWKKNAIWACDTHTGRLTRGPWSGHDSRIQPLAFSPNGEKLVSSSNDGQIRCWNPVDLLTHSQASAGFLGIGTHMKDGWVMGVDGKLLFWVPKDYRALLVWPGTTALFGSGIPVELDLSNFRYGEKWMKCFEGGTWEAA